MASASRRQCAPRSSAGARCSSTSSTSVTTTTRSLRANVSAHSCCLTRLSRRKARLKSGAGGGGGLDNNRALTEPARHRVAQGESALGRRSGGKELGNASSLLSNLIGERGVLLRINVVEATAEHRYRPSTFFQR